MGALGPATAELARACAEALAFLSAQPDVVEAEAFAAANDQLLARLCYTSAIACNGVEEPKSSGSHGIGLQVVFRHPDGPRLGFGAEPSDVSLEGVRRALAKAREGAVHDPAFVSLPRPGRERRTLAGYHDPRLLDVADETLVGAGWTVLGGALRAFMASAELAALAGSEAALARLGLLLGGDVTILNERVAIASTAMPEPQTDESTLLMASVTAMVEAHEAKGSGWSTGISLDDLTDEAGAEAARNAVAAVGGERVPTGVYPVVLGPQPVADLLNNLVLPALHAASFYAGSTPFLGRLGQRVASPRLTIYDDGARRGLMGSKGITCEGLPTGRTDLIVDGVLTGLLTSWYDSQRLARDPHARHKLGVDPREAAAALVPRNGFRFAAGGGRQFGLPPGTAATNVVVEGRDPVPLPELLRLVGDGLYVGRIWYTYPINGLQAGDFTCTVVGDSYLIRDGRLAAPLRANAIRIDDTLRSVLEGIVAVTPEARATMVWAADEVVHAPAVAVTGLRVHEVGGASGLP